uniref:Uncharacterized protein n=1 Tax=Zooxanthella nutricula TaxID=1333877 RepID=A0A7S2P2J0_9DINO
MLVHQGFVNFYGAIMVTMFFLVLSVFYWFAGSTSSREFLAFLLLGFAIVANVMFVCWMACQAVKLIIEGCAEELARRKKAREEHMNRSVARDEVHLALRARNMLSGVLPVGSLMPKLVMPELAGRSLWQKIMRVHLDGQGALIWFDVHTEELVLGLHPDRFAHDQRISSYMRRKLANAGPFLTDQDRDYVAMGLRDAFLYLIVECDLNVVHCSLLEFLIRAAFAMHREQELNSLANRPSMAPVPEPVGEPVNAEDRLVDLLFDEATFSDGLTAADFQSHLVEVTKMPKAEVKQLVARFLEEDASRSSMR